VPIHKWHLAPEFKAGTTYHFWMGTGSPAECQMEEGGNRGHTPEISMNIFAWPWMLPFCFA
jgi:hypothetical protein